MQDLTLYEGQPVTLSGDGFIQYQDAGMDFLPPLRPLVRSACETVKADIAGRQKPKPMFVTSGGEWRARRRAKKLDKFVEGQMCQAMGIYANFWELMEEGFHDASKIGDGFVKIIADQEHRRVYGEKVNAWELFVDPVEGKYGCPQNLFHIYPMEVDKVIEMFVEFDDNGDPVDADNWDKYNGILAAGKPWMNLPITRVVEQLKIREAWRLPFSKDTPGKHVICVENVVLFEEDWEWDSFPFIHIWWEKKTGSFWSQGIGSAHGAQHVEVNESANRLKNRIRICSTKRTYVPEGGVEISHMEEGGMPEIIIPVKSRELIPVETETPPATGEEFQWVETGESKFYAMSGVSQMSASSQKEPGLNSGVALRTMNDIGAVRFTPKARRYEQCFATAGKLFVRAAATIADDEGGYLVNWPGKRFLSKLNWKDVSLDEDLYDIRVPSVSMFSREPAAVMQTAQELHQAGIINRETFLQMIPMPDLDSMFSRETAEREFLEELFDRFLDSENDDELEKLGGYESPAAFIINKNAAMWLAVSTYWEAKRDRAPDFCLELLERWISELDKQIKALSAPPPSPEAPGALPAGATPPATTVLRGQAA
jgi:hypothetical protein